MKSVPAIRISKCNEASVRPGANYVLYWMIAGRRLRYNFALDRALEHCRALPKPLVIFEALRVGYPWASDRLHRFVLDGMAANARYCKSHGTAICLTLSRPKARAKDCFARWQKRPAWS